MNLSGTGRTGDAEKTGQSCLADCRLTMKLIFAGTPEFAAAALRTLLAAGHEIALVLTQPDRPAGRGMKLKPSPVKEVALEHGLRVEQPLSLKTEEAQAMLREIGAELMVVAAYGLLLPKAVLDIPPRGCLNIHASLLPRWRGAAPIQRAILAGDSETGITIMQMDVGLDTGAMLSVHPLTIADDDTAASLHDKLAVCGAEAIVSTLATGWPECAAAAGTRRHLRPQADQGRGRGELATASRRHCPRHPCLQPGPGCLYPAGWRAAQAVAGPCHCRSGRTWPGGACGCRWRGGGQWRRTGGADQLQAAGGKRLGARDFAAGRATLAGTRLGQ
jgi:methionyl-tRNA formyltransferase